MINITKVQLRGTKSNTENRNEQLTAVMMPVYERMEMNMGRVISEEERQKKLLEAQLDDLRGEVRTLTEQIEDA